MNKKVFISLVMALAMLTIHAQDSIEWVSDTMATADSVQVEEIPSVTATANEAAIEQTPAQPASGSGLGWLVMACGITALIALGAGVMALMARREVAELREQMHAALDETNDNMRRLAQESARELNAVRTQHTQQRTTVQERRTPTAAPRTTAKPQGPHTIYLAKPDAQDCFTRASDHFELGNSLFALTTTDGVHGTFVVIDNADVHRFALMMPTDNLTRACSGDGIQLSSGKTRIITDQPGEAVFEQGAWRITRKAAIHYT
ncbi:MAG: hypothetical protein IJ775_05335 [Muribaculaceae bacterium]|nr:hypothetical protein [Muribaculaceae bacterium]